MEIELKYLIDDSRKMQEILQDEAVRRRMEGREIRKIPMRAVYYDTPDKALRKQKIAFRVRNEGGRQVATLKWGGGSQEGMHRREERNVLLPTGENAPELTLFRDEAIWEKLAPIAAGETLVPLMTMDFLRLEVELREAETRCVLSVDRGEIQVAQSHVSASEHVARRILRSPIQELEIELISGREEVIREIGEELSGKYGLKPCDISKFQRGFALIG